MKKLIFIILLLFTSIVSEADTFVYHTTHYQWQIENNTKWTQGKYEATIIYNDDDTFNSFIIVNTPVSVIFYIDHITSEVVNGIRGFDLESHTDNGDLYNIVIYNYKGYLFYVFFGKINLLYRIKLS